MAGGRPTIMTESTIQKLEQAFLMGCTDLEACLFADISKSTLYNYQEQNPEFVERKAALKENPFMLSRKVLLEALNDGDRATAHKMLDRKEGSKVAITGAEGGPLAISITAADAKL